MELMKPQWEKKKKVHIASMLRCNTSSSTNTITLTHSSSSAILSFSSMKLTPSKASTWTAHKSEFRRK
ncbi:hypothetical protein ABKV19_014128 [Rosa sericea]